jgi:hypothetical protein
VSDLRSKRGKVIERRLLKAKKIGGTLGS